MFLREEGLTTKQIAARFGVADGSIRDLFCDPDGSKARKRKDGYRGRCADCGGFTTGSYGRARQSIHCAKCAPKHSVKKVWNKQTVIAAIKKWADEYGEPPRATDWNPHTPRSDPEKFYSDFYPHVSTVQYVFGSWNEAIRAAGFKPRSQGHKVDKLRTKHWSLVENPESLSRQD